MKNFVFIIISSLLFFSCNKDEPLKLETFSTEAFAFDVGDYWEVNASTRVKGFAQVEGENNFSATIAYDIDLITPSGDTLKALVSRVEDKSDSERLMDFPLEAQFELDSTYTEGTYTVIFNIKDASTEQTTVSETSFNLGGE